MLKAGVVCTRRHRVSEFNRHQVFRQFCVCKNRSNSVETDGVIIGALRIDVNQEVPEELYDAVAEVLNFVYQLKKSA